MHVALEQSYTGNIYMFVAHAIKPLTVYLFLGVLQLPQQGHQHQHAAEC
jgi:hypothetical protein